MNIEISNNYNKTSIILIIIINYKKNIYIYIIQMK